MDDPPVGGNDVAGLDLDDVTGHDVDRRHENDSAVAQHLGLRHLQVESIDAGPRLQLLPRAEDDVEEDQQRRPMKPVETSPIAKLTTVTATSMMFIGSRSCCSAMAHTDGGRSRSIAFGP